MPLTIIRIQGPPAVIPLASQTPGGLAAATPRIVVVLWLYPPSGVVSGR